MICAKLRENKTGRICLSVIGHANAGNIGRDIVCASASMLAYTIAQTVKNYYEMGALECPPKIILKSGRSNVTCIPKKDYYEEVKHAYIVVQTGLNLLAHNYPQYVSLIRFDEE